MNLADWLDATARAKPETPAIFEGTELYATYAGFAATGSHAVNSPRWPPGPAYIRALAPTYGVPAR